MHRVGFATDIDTGVLINKIIVKTTLMTTFKMFYSKWTIDRPHKL